MIEKRCLLRSSLHFEVVYAVIESRKEESESINLDITEDNVTNVVRVLKLLRLRRESLNKYSGEDMEYRLDQFAVTRAEYKDFKRFFTTTLFCLL